MAKQELRALFAKMEIYPISLEQGTFRCLKELGYGAAGPSEVVVGTSLNEIMELTNRSKSISLANFET